MSSPGVKTRFGKSLSRLVGRRAIWKSYLNRIVGNRWENRNRYYLLGIMIYLQSQACEHPKAECGLKDWTKNLHVLLVIVQDACSVLHVQDAVG
jgi:hypothetical protein